MYNGIRRVFEDHCKPSDSLEVRRAGAFRFVDNFRRDLGLTENENGRPIIKDAKASPHGFSLLGLAQGLIGEDWAEKMGIDSAQSHRVFEAGGNPVITPGNLPNVSAFLGSVTGLLDAALLESYDKPEYIIDQLVPTVPSKTRQSKLIGLGRIGNQSQRRNPGDGHAWAQFQDRYVTTPETQQDALAMGVAYESVFFDQTGEVLAQASALGDELGLKKELDGFGVVSGAVNPYSYKGAAYNTYLTSGNWINDQVNVLTDWTDIDLVNELFGRMTDQETGNRITVSWDTILCSPSKHMTARYISHAVEIETRTDSAAQVRRGPNLGESKRILSSPYLDQVLTSTVALGGLNLSQSDANQYWFALKTDKTKSAFVRMENWPFQVRRAAPNDFNMLERNLVLAIFSNQMHIFATREPRYVIRNKPS